MSQIEVNVPETLLHQLEHTAKKEGVSLEQYILFALTRQTLLTPVIRNVSEEDAGRQYEIFTERIKRLGKASDEEIERVLQEREAVEPEPGLNPEIVLRLKSRIAEAREKSP